MNRFTLGLLVSALFLLQNQSWAQVQGVQVQVAEAPVSNLPLTIAAIESAHQTLLLNMYELSSPEIADALVNRIQAGVHVEILEEGQPVGGLSTASKGIQSQLVQAMRTASSGDRLLEMTSEAGAHATVKRRFRYDHAKYAVIDGSSLLIGFENYSPTGNPVPGTVGNRGWEVLIHDAGIASQFAAVFASDTDMSYGDVLDLTQSSESEKALGTVRILPISPSHLVGKAPALLASSITKVTSPDTSLSGLLALLNHAETSIDIEQMTFDSSFQPLDAVVSAARRGVKVRVLLNDESVFDHPTATSTSKNQPTVDAMNEVASSEGLNLSAKIADIKAMGVDYIHNKGVLVDGKQTLISSINWDQNSVKENREAAVVIASPQVFSHYEALFVSDWNAGANSQDPEAAPYQQVATQADLDCPLELHVSVDVDQLTSGSTGYACISGKRLEGDFFKAIGDGCVLINESARSHATFERQFLEIRKLKSGKRVIVMEGYTPESKLYSIRAKDVSRSGAIHGQYDAVVYDGSGPSRETLGTAIFTLEEVK